MDEYLLTMDSHICYIITPSSIYSKPNGGDTFMTKNNRAKYTFFFITASVAVISVIVRCILTLTVLESEYGVYQRGNSAPIVYHIILALVCIAFAVLSFVKSPGNTGNFRIPYSDFTVFTSFAAAFLLVLRIGLLSYNIIIIGTEHSVFDIFEIVFSVPAIVYFIMLPMKKPSASLAAASFAPIAWCAVNLIRIYFDNSQLMTSPNKTLNEIALLFAMLYFLNESRNLIGTFSKRFFLASAFVASVMLLTAAIPNLFLADLLSIGESDNFMTYAVCAVFGLFILGRLFAYAKGNTNKNEPDTSAHTEK